jgi:hypothetical protein
MVDVLFPLERNVVFVIWNVATKPINTTQMSSKQVVEIKKYQ